MVVFKWAKLGDCSRATGFIQLVHDAVMTHVKHLRRRFACCFVRHFAVSLSQEVAYAINDDSDRPSGGTYQP